MEFTSTNVTPQELDELIIHRTHNNIAIEMDRFNNFETLIDFENCETYYCTRDYRWMCKKKQDKPKVKLTTRRARKSKVLDNYGVPSVITYNK